MKMDFSKEKLSCSKLEIVLSVKKGLVTATDMGKLEIIMAKENSGKPLTSTQKEDKIKILAKIDNKDEFGLSKNCVSYLMEIYERKKYGTQFRPLGGVPVESMMNGIKAEPESLKLLSEYYQKPFFKDKRLIQNDRLHGKIDIMDAPTIESASEILDIKSILWLKDFLSLIESPIDKGDHLQMQGYLAITGKDHGKIGYCLPSYSEETIFFQKELMMAKLCPDGKETEKFKKEWAKAENSMRRVGLSVKERVIVLDVTRDDKIISDIYEKVDICRDWLNHFAKKHKDIIDYGIKSNT